MTPTRKLGIGAFLLGSVVGGAFGVSGLANAASADTTATTTPVVTDDSSSTTSDAPDETGDTSDTDVTDVTGDAPAGPHAANGITEEELTGDTAASVEAAVLAAYPDATIERMETDAEGDAYEAHVTLADGSRATVQLDSSFTVSGTETGPDGHRGGPGGQCDDATADDTTDDATATTDTADTADTATADT